MDAKKWLEKNFLFHSNGVPNAMEEYASYKTKELEDKIQSFREYLKLSCIYFEDESNDTKYHKNANRQHLQNFDRHFNLKNES